MDGLCFNNIKFVQIVERYAILYDHTLENYSNRRIQEKTWNEVGKQVNERGTVCKDKWRNIRSAYSRYLRQIVPLNGSDAPKKKYYLAEYLNFLLPFTKHKVQKSRISSPQFVNDETNDSIQDEYFKIELSESQVQNVNFLNQDENEEMEEFNTNNSHTNERITKVPKLTTEKCKEIDPLDDCEIDYFSLEKTNQVENVEDADLLFLKSLLPDLRKMTPHQKHEFKMKTMQIIGEIMYNF